MEFLELRLAAHNLTKQRAFYGEVLELPVLAESPTGLTLQAGTTRLHFGAGRAEAGVYHLAFTIPANKLQEAKNWLGARLQLLTKDGEDHFTSDSWDAEQVYFLDADGNILELIARHELPNSSPDPFGPDQLLNVSEIGYAVPEVAKTIAALSRKVGLELYRDAAADFAPVGDAQGLLIVAALSRPWFPTDSPATPLPLELTVASPVAFDYTEPGLPYRIVGVKTEPSADS